MEYNISLPEVLEEEIDEEEEEKEVVAVETSTETELPKKIEQMKLF